MVLEYKHYIRFNTYISSLSITYICSTKKQKKKQNYIYKFYMLTILCHFHRMSSSFGEHAAGAGLCTKTCVQHERSPCPFIGVLSICENFVVHVQYSTRNLAELFSYTESTEHVTCNDGPPYLTKPKGERSLAFIPN